MLCSLDTFVKKYFLLKSIVLMESLAISLLEIETPFKSLKPRVFIINVTSHSIKGDLRRLSPRLFLEVLSKLVTFFHRRSDRPTHTHMLTRSSKYVSAVFFLLWKDPEVLFVPGASRFLLLDDDSLFLTRLFRKPRHSSAAVIHLDCVFACETFDGCIFKNLTGIRPVRVKFIRWHWTGDAGISDYWFI